jgi:diacylglycerol kinase family enzyme
MLLVGLATVPCVFYPYLIPLWVVQCWHVYQIRQANLHYLKARHWRYHNGQWSLLMLQGAVDAQVVHDVDVDLHHLWPVLAIFKFKKEGHWYWEIIYRDAIDAESFRQLRAMLNISNKTQVKHKVKDKNGH